MSSCCTANHSVPPIVLPIVLPGPQITRMSVRDAIETALACAGPMVTKHYRSGWGAVGVLPGGKEKDGGCEVV